MSGTEDAAALGPLEGPAPPGPPEGPGPGTRGRHIVLALALVCSVAVHALLLGLTFGGAGLGLPGFGLPWRDRRIEAPDLRLVLVPPSTEGADLAVAAPAPSSTTAPATLHPAALAIQAKQAGVDSDEIDGSVMVTDLPAATPIAPAKAEPVQSPVGDKTLARAAPAQTPESAAPDLSPTNLPLSPLPLLDAVPDAPKSVAKVAASASSPQAATTTQRVLVDAAQVALQQEQQQASARLAAAKLEARREEDAALAAARQEAVRIEAARVDAARAQAAQYEAQRLEAARQETARQELTRQDTARRGAAQAVLDAAAKREARLQEIGRQLDEEAAKRAAGSTAATAAHEGNKLPLSFSTARRARLWGRSDSNLELVQYAEAWARRIQLNTPVGPIRELVKRAQTSPLLTVAIRSDGSVESVTFVVSSGAAQVDEAIRRVVESQRPAAFPQALANEFDVIEIRRTWHLDDAIRID